ncbi:CBS domain-containing protein [Methylobacterium haplocladii]|uniref:CBS domain-containing protein n=1 Tax=Methylobacterium haplocladii TaxID=1176176 RepID=A0A512IQM8_9HYPH|nr:CBS domain-containing protein [Methylobacterium haplocladii]GEO99975.1 hypothetical protein MHA02_23630 [Methylobacterium haplocladii]GLS60467.1 hypothetical protein GCM10007887_31460 [Methylobacterium haplocladii]
MDRETGRAHDTASAARVHRDGAVGEARRLSRPGAGALLVVDGHPADATVVGLLSERDVVRALGAHGPDVYGPCIRVVTEQDFPAIDVDHIASMDGFRVGAILSFWDCSGAAGAAHA